MTKKPDFRQLWDKLVAAAQEVGDSRIRATLLNHSTQKEYICRKLGVICESDISRVRRNFKRVDE